MLIVTTGDFGSLIKLNIKKDDGVTPYDLTGCTVEGDIVKADGTVAHVGFTISDATSGAVQYQLTASDTNVVGDVSIYVAVVCGTAYRITSETVVPYTVLPLDGGVA